MGDVEWGILKLPSSRDAAAAWMQVQQLQRTGRAGLLQSGGETWSKLSTRNVKEGLRWITLDDIIIY